MVYFCVKDVQKLDSKKYIRMASKRDWLALLTHIHTHQPFYIHRECGQYLPFDRWIKFNKLITWIWHLIEVQLVFTIDRMKFFFLAWEKNLRIYREFLAKKASRFCFSRLGSVLKSLQWIGTLNIGWTWELFSNFEMNGSYYLYPE